MTFLYKEETYNIIGACMEVHRCLGNGFLEAVYSEALEMEMNERGIPFLREEIIEIRYKGRLLKKKYVADFICYDAIILELKALSEINTQHEAQVLNYLKASGYKVGLLVNFGDSTLKYKRLVK